MDRLTKNYQEFLIAIVEQAIYDYLSASKILKKSTNKQDIKDAENRIKEVERFFFSKWGRFCTDDKSEYYLRLLKAKANQDE